MVDVTKRTVTKKRHEYRIASPATVRDMRDLMHVVMQDMTAAGRDVSFDDAFHIESWDDELLAYWDEDSAD